MNWFKNMRIRTKMLFSFMLIIVLVLAMVVIAVSRIRGVGVNYDTVIQHPVALRATILEFQSEYRNLRRLGSTIAIHAGTGSEDYEPLYRQVQEAHGRALRILDAAKNIVNTNPELTREEKDLRIGNNDILQSLFIRYHSEVTLPIVEATRARNQAELLRILSTSEAIADSVGAKTIEMLVSATETAETQISRAKANARSAIILLVVISSVAAVIAVVISFLVASYMCRPLTPLTKFMMNVSTLGDINFPAEDIVIMEQFSRSRDEMGQVIAAAVGFVRRIIEVGKALESVADGDLTRSIPLLSDRDSMGLAFGKMLDNLNSMCGEISASSIQVATAASQVTAGAEALSSGATEQSASVEELSVAVAEVAERIKHTAQVAGEASDLANSIRDSAEESNQKMDAMMKAVTEISEASQSIRKIIGTIDEIAFQTNILAVNAAVEAAHAGKYGKGFSVVASEVRSLAAKSAEAAKDTERLIANSMEKAELGVLIAGETATSLSGIVSGINDNSHLVSEIARSSVEQSTNISQINGGLNQVSRVVQQNSVTAEESAAASEEMAGQSIMLQKLAARFKLRDGQRAYGASDLSAEVLSLRLPEARRKKYLNPPRYEPK